MELTERVILIGVQTDDCDVSQSLAELAELLQTAGAETVGTVIQNREAAHAGTYIGKGKIEEVRELIRETGATGVVCDDELSPAQMKNLEEQLDTKVMDRTVVILDIFASHAASREGKLQVELAQHRYHLTRLAGYGKSMSRLGGGIGTRGPGETKLETDRRRIRQRISTLKAELKELVRQRSVRRSRREKNAIPVAAIVGYTNAGKSTLLNALTGADVLSEDKLFATLDPTTRSCILPHGEKVLFTDTVGFIRKLPHHLIEAFRSTLEEARFSDLIIHVADVSDPDCQEHMTVVYDTLRALDIGGKPVLTVFNKCDLIPEGRLPSDSRAEKVIRISAKTGEGLDELLLAVEDILRDGRMYMEHLYSYKDAGEIGIIRNAGQLLTEEYREDGVFVSAWVPKTLYRRLFLTGQQEDM
ncbi:MAG: GTPase HflX [Lachnospiraceae bacterium]|nr:GTPase HflX [Lachnospiraceae bacterium]